MDFHFSRHSIVCFNGVSFSLALTSSSPASKRCNESTAKKKEKTWFYFVVFTMCRCTCDKSHDSPVTTRHMLLYSIVRIKSFLSQDFGCTDVYVKLYRFVNAFRIIIYIDDINVHIRAQTLLFAVMSGLFFFFFFFFLSFFMSSMVVSYPYIPPYIVYVHISIDNRFASMQ